MDGSHKDKCRFRDTKVLAEKLARQCDVLETGSKAGDLSKREIVAAQHDRLVTEEEARKLAGGRPVNLYDLDRVVEQFKTSSSVANTPYGHKVNMNRVGHLKGWLEKNPIPILDEAAIKRFIRDRKDGRIRFAHPRTGHYAKRPSPKTVALDLQILRQLIDEAVALGMVETNPARDIKVPVKTSRVRRALSPEEVKALLARARLDRGMLKGCLYGIVTVALYCGLRRQEAAFLEWSDLDFTARKVHVQSKKLPEGYEMAEYTPKSGEARSVNMPDRLAEVLQEYRQGREGRFVFGGNMPLRLDSVTHGFKDLAARAGLGEDVSFHHLRHTWISWLLQKTGDLSYVKDAAGHSDIETTKSYIHTVHSPRAPEKDLDFEA